MDLACWSGPTEDPFANFTAVLRNGVVEEYNAKTGAVLSSYEGAKNVRGAGAIVLHGDRRLLTCTEEGTMRVVPWSTKSGKFDEKRASEFTVPKDVSRCGVSILFVEFKCLPTVNCHY